MLELLAFRLAGLNNPRTGQPFETNVEVTGDTLDAGDVAYVPSNWIIGQPPAVGVAELLNMKQQVAGVPYSQTPDLDTRTRARLVLRAAGVATRPTFPSHVLSEKLPDDFSYLLGTSDLVTNLSYVFFAYRLRRVELVAKYGNPEEADKRLGPAPWVVLNEILEVAGFPYEASSPPTDTILKPYDFVLIDRRSRFELRTHQLSSGEAALLGIVGWLYGAQHHGVFPKLLLLDEPDARLHPSMTRQFLDIVNEVLVGRYRVRVIMTTHSPSTVALAPEGSVFEMSREEPRVQRSESREKAVALLTAGLVTVTPSTRYVFVEDAVDAEFYGVIRDLLTDYGPGKDAHALAPSPSIVFLPVSAGRGADKVGGGKGQVSNWVEKLQDFPLQSSFLGLIDGDSGNSPRPRIAVVSRYSIENYLLDPFNVYGALLDANRAPPVTGLALGVGKEHTLKSQPRIILQALADEVLSKAEPKLGTVASTECARDEVPYTNGVVIALPKWLLKRRGHDLMTAFRAAFGASAIHPDALLKACKRVRLIPTDLADTLRSLQQ